MPAKVIGTLFCSDGEPCAAVGALICSRSIMYVRRSRYYWYAFKVAGQTLPVPWFPNERSDVADVSDQKSVGAFGSLGTERLDFCHTLRACLRMSPRVSPCILLSDLQITSLLIRSKVLVPWTWDAGCIDRHHTLLIIGGELELGFGQMWQ